MSDLDRRFREGVQGERKRIAGEAAAAAATERMQAQIAAKLEEYTAVFKDREACRFLAPTLTRSDYGVFGITMQPSDQALAIVAQMQDPRRNQRRHVAVPRPVTLHIGAFSDLSEVTAEGVLEQLAKSFVFHETSIQNLRATFARFEAELADLDKAMDVHPDSKMLIWGGIGVLMLLLVMNLVL